jgi:hypothetical protein
MGSLLISVPICLGHNNGAGYRCHGVESTGADLLAVDAVSGLLRMTKISMFLCLRKEAMFLNIESKSLVGEDVPRIADRFVVVIISSVGLAR